MGFFFQFAYTGSSGFRMKSRQSGASFDLRRLFFTFAQLDFAEMTSAFLTVR